MLGLVLWKIWPRFEKFIDKIEDRLSRYEKALELARAEAINSDREKTAMANKFANVLEKYNESNKETARQLGRNSDIQAENAKIQTENAKQISIIAQTTQLMADALQVRQKRFRGEHP